MSPAPLILLAAGGTGGHLFPAEALGVELIRRGLRVRLATDSRALRYGGLFSREMIDVVPSETVRGRAPWSLAYTGVMLAAGMAVSLNLMRRLKPAAVVGFGGYPTLPPLLAARLSGVPGIVHEANASGDPCCRRGEICVTHTHRPVAVAGGWRQPGRARDGRYRPWRDGAAGAGAV